MFKIATLKLCAEFINPFNFIYKGKRQSLKKSIKKSCVKMKIGVKVGDIMTRDFVSIKPDVSILDCARKMVKKRVGSLILKENDKLRGIITEGDIIWAMTKKSRRDLKKIRASEITPRKLITIKPSADLYEALQKMKKTKYRWLPVTVKGNVIGFLTLKDVLRIEPNLFGTAQEILQIREESQKLKRIKAGEKFIEGLCEECGSYGMLYKVDNRMICESCRDSM